MRAQQRLRAQPLLCSVSKRTRNREEPAEAATVGIPADEITGMLRDLTAELVERSASEAELRTRLELTAQTESTLREELARERERADRLEAELREARKPPPALRDVPEMAVEDVCPVV